MAFQTTQWFLRLDGVQLPLSALHQARGGAPRCTSRPCCLPPGGDRPPLCLPGPAQPEAVISGSLDGENATLHSYEPLAFELPSLFDSIMPAAALNASRAANGTEAAAARRWSADNATADLMMAHHSLSVVAVRPGGEQDVLLLGPSQASGGAAAAIKTLRRLGA